ncbi:MAG: RIO1 family regulatory kinase/ATPase [Anaerolineae bacterium]
MNDSKIHHIDYDHYEYEYDYDAQRGDRRARRESRKAPNHKPKLSAADLVALVAERDDTVETGFDTTYVPSEYERGWLIDALGGFYSVGDITDVLRLVKGGKEACVYLCRANPDLGVEHVAAKVYRPRRFRNLRNDALYRHGRLTLDADGKELHDSRALHAIQKGTDRGKLLQHVSWMAHEYAALQELSDAGADVPRPLASASNVILMSYVGDELQGAPTLSHVTLPRDEAAALLERILANVELMLERGIVHGDLSAYNVLYWRGDVSLIDFPQVIDPRDNPVARAVFERDIRRLCQYFAKQGVAADAPGIAADLWERHVRDDLWLELEPEFAAAAADLADDE